jgi:hypothetical protein
VSRRPRGVLILVLGVIGLAGTFAALDARTATGSTTFAAFAAEDTVPPSIAVLSTELFRLRYPRGVYSLRLRVVIRDDVGGNPVGYTVVVRGGTLALARKIGTTASGTISLVLRIRPRRPSRSIRVVVTAIDPVGNKASLTRTVRLPL